MKLNPEFITHLTNDEAILVPLGGAQFHGIVRGNATLGAILERLKQDTTEAPRVRRARRNGRRGRAPRRGTAARHRCDRWVNRSPTNPILTATGG